MERVPVSAVVRSITTGAPAMMAARHVMEGRERHRVDTFDLRRSWPPAPVAGDLVADAGMSAVQVPVRPASDSRLKTLATRRSRSSSEAARTAIECCVT